MRRFSVLSSGRARRVGALVLVACLLAIATGGAAVLHARGAASQTSRQLSQARQAADSPALLLGGRGVITSPRRDHAGRAEGFRFLDRTPGVARAVAVYVGAGTHSRTLVVGLYSDRSGSPRSLLASGSARVRGNGRWVTVAVRRTTIVQGRAYWVAVMGTDGRLEIRGDRSPACQSETDPATRLRDLPRSWRQGGARPACASVYVSGSRSVVAVSPPVTSPISPPPIVSPPAIVTAPTISGGAAAGSTLSADLGGWSGSPTAFAYQWQECASPTSCTNIPGASGSTYVVRSADVGDAIDVVITATNAGGSVSATSSRTQAVPPTGQSVAFWLAWSGTIQESQIPWNAVTQVDLFSLTSNTKTSGCSSNCTTLNPNPTGISRMNVPAWTAAIHSHGKLAMISIGGSNDQDWAHACAAVNLPGFAAKLVSYMVSGGFDGVDIDIESLQGSGPQLALWSQCVKTIAQTAHAATTQAGRTPIVSTDIDQSWMDEAVAGFEQWPDQFNLMYYGYPTGSYSCANSCSKVDSLVRAMHVTGHVPYDEMVLGMSPGGGQDPCCYKNLATTATGVAAGGSVSSISVSSGLRAALPAGNVVLSSGENPPAHYEIFTTPGAARGATSIPVTGTVSGSGGDAFPSGSRIQSDYSGPWDCGNFAQYAKSTGLEGVMIWDLQEEAAEHHGQFPCFAQVAPYVGSPP